jgi:DNA-binding NarL/FixJ family response regulator
MDTAVSSMPGAPGAPGAAERLRIVLAEDESLLRDLMRTALSSRPRLEVVGAFANGEAVVEGAARLRPDVALLDIELGGEINGIQAGMLLRRQLPAIGIVLLSGQGAPRVLASLPQDTLSGWSYLLKGSVRDVDSLERAIEGAAAGFMVIDPKLVHARQARSGGVLDRLTPRQREILALVAQGYTNAGIAEQLVIAVKTVEKQLNLLYQELGVDRSTSALHPRVKAVLAFLEESHADASLPF